MNRKLQAETVLRTETDELWYSEDYIKQQIEKSFRAGIMQGIRIDFHAIHPRDEEHVERLFNQFWSRVDEEYEKRFNDGHVWGQVNRKKERKFV